jgi:hypothetical protein
MALQATLMLDERTPVQQKELYVAARCDSKQQMMTLRDVLCTARIWSRAGVTSKQHMTRIFPGQEYVHGQP